MVATLPSQTPRPPANSARPDIGPQPGPQTAFLASKANICIYGGAAGGGKSWALLLEAFRHYRNPQFAGLMFRRNTQMIRKAGSLWDQSRSLYGATGARELSNTLTWKFPSGAKVQMCGLEHESSVFDYHGAQVPFMAFDELTQFTEAQFFYMLSRCRSVSGVSGYIRATCNPDPDSWVATFISWWIDQDTGYPIAERSGVLRWFVRINDKIEWGDTRKELIERFGKEFPPQSVTFIGAKLTDNPILLKTDPSYIGKLKAMSLVDQQRLLGGNWKIRFSSGMVFRREWFPIVDAAPAGIQHVRYWDRAGGVKPVKAGEIVKLDWTAGVKMGRDPAGVFYIMDVSRFQGNPGQVMNGIKNIASQDGPFCEIVVEQDPGQAGVADAGHYVRELAQYTIHAVPVAKDKVTRANPASAQAYAGNIRLVRGPWNEAFLTELINFPSGADDQVDGFSGAFNYLVAGAPPLASGECVYGGGTLRLTEAQWKPRRWR